MDRSDAIRTRALLVGIAMLLCVNLIDGLKEVYFGILLQSLDSIVVAFILFAFAWPLFIALHLTTPAKRRQATTTPTGGWPMLLGLNLSSAVLWTGFLVALKWLEPSIVSALVGGIGIVATVLMNRIARPQAAMLRADYLAAGMIAVASAFLCWVAAAGHAAALPADRWTVALGVLATVACGAAMAVTTVFSKMLAERGMPSRRIYAHRFYLLFTLSGAYALANPASLSAALAHIVPLAALAVLGVVLPLLLLQEGVKRCEPVTIESILAAAPLFTLLFQQLDHRLEFSLFSLIGVTAICLAAAYNGYTHIKNSPSQGIPT